MDDSGISAAHRFALLAEQAEREQKYQLAISHHKSAASHLSTLAAVQIDPSIRILHQSHLRAADRIERALHSAVVLPLPSAVSSSLAAHLPAHAVAVSPLPIAVSTHSRVADASAALASADDSIARRSPLRALDAASAASAGESLDAVTHSLAALSPPPVPTALHSSAECEQENALLRESIARFQRDTSAKLAHMAALLRSASRDSAVNQLSKGSDTHAMARQPQPATSAPLVHQSRSHGSLGSSNLTSSNTSSGNASSPASAIGQPSDSAQTSEVGEAGTSSSTSSGNSSTSGTSSGSSQTGSHIEDDATQQLRADLVATRAALAQHNAVVRRASARIAALEAENRRCVEQLVQEREIRAKQARLIERLTAAMAGGGGDKRHTATSDAAAAASASFTIASSSSAAAASSSGAAAAAVTASVASDSVAASHKSS